MSRQKVSWQSRPCFTRRQTQVQRDLRRELWVHSLYQASISLALDVTPQAWAKPVALWMIRWPFCDILDINIAGILYIPSPYPYAFLPSPSKATVKPSNLRNMGLCVFPLPASRIEGICCDPLRLCVCVCLHVYKLWAHILPKSASLLTFNGRSMTEWSSRSSPHLPQLLSVVTFRQTTGNRGHPDLPQPMFIQERGGPSETRGTAWKRRSLSKERKWNC